jgi:hypothetical protein
MPRSVAIWTVASEFSGPNRTVGERHAGAARGQDGSASVTPASPTTIRVVATGGMEDWRITLIVGPERLGMCWRCVCPEPRSALVGSR